MSSERYQGLCPGCFAEKDNIVICPHCGYNESLKRSPLVMPHRVLLHHGQYLIGRILGKPGGFGITYLAYDTRLQNLVAIKEYLPRDQAGRDTDHLTITPHSADDEELFKFGLTQFLAEARTLAQFDHPNVVKVKTFFDENSTGYLVMDYYEGLTLSEYLEHQGGKLPEKTAVGILMPILDGLREVHAKGFLHRDIKPQNIYLTTGNRPILLDFGAARFAMGERSRSLSVVLSEGYAPYEQYHRRGEQGPWTDIYACAAVLYHMVTGELPPPATERRDKDELKDPRDFGVSDSVAQAIEQGLAMEPKTRPGSVQAFQDGLAGNQQAPNDDDSEVTIVVSCPSCSTGNRIPQGKSLDEATCGKCGNKLGAVIEEELITASCRSCSTINRIPKSKSLQDAQCGKCGKGLGGSISAGWKWALGIGGVLLVIVLLSMMGGEEEPPPAPIPPDPAPAAAPAADAASSDTAASAEGRYIAIVNAGQIYPTLNNSDCVNDWPSEEIKNASGQNGWGSYYPRDGHTGTVRAIITHCDNGEIYLISVPFSGNEIFVPIGKSGVVFQ